MGSRLRIALSSPYIHHTAPRHFHHRITEQVLREWIRVLKPGGLLQIAVPDVDKCFAARAAGKPWPFEQYLMGGQVDKDDFHGAIFDEWSTRGLMRNVGLRHIRRWQPIIDDTAALPISLNLQGIKASDVVCKSTVAVMSVPRLTFIDNFRCATDVLGKLDINLYASGRAFWHKAMTQAFAGLGRSRPVHSLYRLRFDLRSDEAVEDLHYLMQTTQEADAICMTPVPAGQNRLLAVRCRRSELPATNDAGGLRGRANATPRGPLWADAVSRSAFADLRKPWFHTVPDEQAVGRRARRGYAILGELPRATQDHLSGQSRRGWSCRTDGDVAGQ